jgi:hypothetical protein
MRTTFLMMTTMCLAACAVESVDSTIDVDEDTATVSQAVIERPSQLELDAWSDIAPLEAHDPQLYALNVDVLAASGVDCVEADPSDGRCLSVDTRQAAAALSQQTPVRCATRCWGSGTWPPFHCTTTCCMDVVYELCAIDYFDTF